MVNSTSSALAYAARHLAPSLKPFLGFCLLMLTGLSHGAEQKYIMLEGSPAQIILQQKSVSRYGADSGNDEFFDIRLASSAASSGRLAKINGHWQGVLIHKETLYFIDAVANSENELSHNRATARSYSSSLELGSCGAQPANITQGSAARAAQQPLTLGNVLNKKTQIDYNQHCQTTINGICLVAELNVIFDIEFEAAFGSSYQSQAIAILEAVNVLYDQFFDIRFNTIRLGFQDDGLITQSENIEDVYNDIEFKRLNGQLASIDPNPFAIFHFISGRDYLNNSSGTIGIAAFPNYTSYPNEVTPLICTPVAFGTSQVFGSGSDRAALTALVVAHEIGHNFGFDHDGQSGSFSANCNDSSSIMEAFIDGNESTFTTCSAAALVGNINQISQIERCFYFPVDGSINALNNPSIMPFPGTFTLNYQVAMEALPTNSPTMSITGNIDQGNATFTSVTLDGTDCALANNDTRYLCSLVATGTTVSLTANVNSSGDDVGVTTTATFNAKFYDTNEDDNEIAETIAFQGPGLAAGNLTALASYNKVTLNWQDRATDETSYSVERSDDGSSWSTLTSGLAVNSTSYSDDTVTSNMAYFYRVGAKFADNSTLYTDAVPVTTGVQPKVTSAARTAGALDAFSLIYLATLILTTSLSLRKRQPF